MGSTVTTDPDAECGLSERFRFTPPSYLLDSPVGRRLMDQDWCGLHASQVLPDTVDCAIVGGGLAAVTMGSYLFHAGLSFCIVDPHWHLAQRFLSMAGAIDLRVLRSPYEHYCGCHWVFDYSMLDIAKMNANRLEDFEEDQLRLATAGIRSVVPVDVFSAHLYHTIVCHRLESMHYRSTVVAVRYCADHWLLSLNAGQQFRARHLVIATGERPVGFTREEPRLRNWYSPEAMAIPATRPLVVGAGETAAQVTQAYLRLGVPVTVAMPTTGFEYRCVDSSTEHFRPSGRYAFWKGRDVHDYYFSPSAMWEFSGRFRAAAANGRLQLITNAKLNENSHLPLVTDERGAVATDRFDAIVPCIGISEDASSQFGMDIGVLDQHCRTGEGAYVIGALARASIGPAARNIDGHRVSVERALRHMLRKDHE